MNESEPKSHLRPSDDDFDFLLHRQESTELTDHWQTIEPEVSRYEHEVLALQEPSAAAAAALQRTLVDLVREDVAKEHRRQSLRSSLKRRLQAWSVSWRELTATSKSFRWASQGALALGVGVFFAGIVHVGLESGARAAEDKQVEEAVVTPVPAELLYRADFGPPSDPIPKVKTSPRKPR
ncbi:MAG: hypothetical protein V3W41_06960 [Planctomycetota bacterium]